MNRYDAVVIGAGPAGSTAALVLARAGWSVAVVEKAQFPRRKVCGEYVSGPSWAILDALAVGDELRRASGPAVTEVGLFAQGIIARGAMPVARDGRAGRAVGRHVLDTALLDAARAAGAHVRQPCAASNVARKRDGYVVELRRPGCAASESIDCALVIAAHGSWESGALPTQSRHGRCEPSSLIAFKARFENARLPAGLMPLVLFPGGYGGLVETDSGSVSFSLCMRHDALKRCREKHPGTRAGDAIMDHVCGCARGAREVLGGARTEGSWLAAGPIRPGIRGCVQDGIFRVGNAAGEAHPLIAEGISMALQSGWLLATLLAATDARSASRARRTMIEWEYARRWRDAFAMRIRAAALFASAAPTHRATASLLAAVPALLTWGARWSGKATPAVAGGAP